MIKTEIREHKTGVIVAIVAIVAIVLMVSSVAKNQQITGAAWWESDKLSPAKTTEDTGAIATGIGSTYPVNGQHYNLNIIGAKNVGDIGQSEGHTLFVQLNGKTKILMTQDPEGQFEVTDRNGLDGEAAFNIAPGKYNIYARALGKPGGKAKIDAWGEFTDAIDGTTLILLGYVDIERAKGRSRALNINELFYVDVTLCLEVNPETGECAKSVVYEDYWVFDIDELLNYYWEYNNQGLKLLQVRFYKCTLDETGTAPDYCRWGDGSPIISKKTIVSS